MLQPAFLEMGAGISEALRSVAGLPDGMASLTYYFERFGVPPEGRRIVIETFKVPVRRVGTGRYNTTTRFASRKMNREVQAESRTVEGPFVQMCEEDPDIVFYLCQPARIYVNQVDKNGRGSRRPRAFDFLLLNVSENPDEAGFWLVECKRSEELEAQAGKPHPNYARDGWRWRFPAAEAAAARLGLRFRVFSSDDVDTTWCMNMAFLSDYVGEPCPDEELAEALMGWLREARSLRIGQALSLPGMQKAVVWWLIANNQAWADWSQELVSDSDTSSIHVSQPVMLASRHLREPLAEAGTSDRVGAVQIEPGFLVRWDGEPYTVFNLGKEGVTLQHVRDDGKAGRLLPSILHDEFWSLVREGTIRGDDASAGARMAAARAALVFGASDKALNHARRCYAVLQEYRETGIVPAGSAERSVRRYEQKAREGKRMYGIELLGLIPPWGRPPGTSDLDAGRQEVMAEAVEKYRRNRGGASYAVAYREFLDACEGRGIDPPPSYPTFVRWLKRACSVWETTLEREGWPSAYDVKPPVRRLKDVPAVPARAFETAHLDHTPVSVKLVSTYTGKVLDARPSLSFMVDGHTGMPLAMHLSFDDPSKVAACAVLLDCIDRHRRLPDNIVVDKGKEFDSVDWEKALVDLNVNKIQRAASSPRVGSPIERHFGISDSEFIHALPGNMKLAKPGKKQSPSHAPGNFAELTFAQFSRGCERWLFEIFPDFVHGTLGGTRKEAFEHSLEHGGERMNRYIPFDAATRMLLSVSADGGSRIVRPARGITVRWLEYWNDQFSHGDVAGTEVDVKIDPLDASVVYARVRGEWTTCWISNGRVHLQGRSWKLVNLAIKMLREQLRAGARRKWVNAARLPKLIAELIEDVAGDGPVGRQAERDRESRGEGRPERGEEGRAHLQLVRNETADALWLDGANEEELDFDSDEEDGAADAESLRCPLASMRSFGKRLRGFGARSRRARSIMTISIRRRRTWNWPSRGRGTSFSWSAPPGSARGFWSRRWKTS